MECGRVSSYLLYGSVTSLPSPSSNIEAWPYGTSLRFASLLHLGHQGYVNISDYVIKISIRVVSIPLKIWYVDLRIFDPVPSTYFRPPIASYRSVSLLPKCWLLFEKLVYRHVYSHVWMKIHAKQFRFQSRKNSVLQLIDYLEYAHGMKTLITYTVYLDYEKAFDKVPHTILLSKLRKIGLDESFFELLSSYQRSDSEC